MTLLSAVERTVAPPRGAARRLLALLVPASSSLKGEVAERMRVSNMTVYRLIKSGQLAAIRVGKNYRLRGNDVERYLADRAVRIRAGK